MKTLATIGQLTKYVFTVDGVFLHYNGKSKIVYKDKSFICTDLDFAGSVMYFFTGHTLIWTNPVLERTPEIPIFFYGKEEDLSFKPGEETIRGSVLNNHLPLSSESIPYLEFVRLLRKDELTDKEISRLIVQ